MSSLEHQDKKLKTEGFDGRTTLEENEKKFLNQESVGIHEYLSRENLKFHAIIKHRFSDFHVHEIDSTGTTIHLQFAQKPQKPEIIKDCAIDSTTTAEPAAIEQQDNVQDQKNQIKSITQELTDLLQLENTNDQFDLFINSPLETSKDTLIQTKPIQEKSHRSLIHEKIRSLNNIVSKLYTTSFDSQTQADNSICIAKQKYKPGKMNQRKSMKLKWDQLGGEFLHFTLYKENKDTMEAISILSRLLKVESKLFTYCGTKDKRGITSQRVSVHKVHAERLAGLNKTLRGLKVGDFKYCPTRLQLGDAQGNHFQILVRDVKPLTQDVKPLTQDVKPLTQESMDQDSKHVLLDRLETVKKIGFINYFGMQRFGSRAISTHVIGKHLLLQEWKEACMLILGRDEPLNQSHVFHQQSRKENQLDFHDARDFFFTTFDAKKALEKYPRFCVAEKSILSCLLRQGAAALQKHHQEEENEATIKTSYLECIQSITRNLRQMYLHAYQSKIWNEMVSKRHAKYGATIVIGDFVIPPAAQGVVNMDQEDDADSEGDKIHLPRGLDNTIEITSQDQAKMYTIHNLVLPLPGHQVKYPSNMVEEYKSIMALDNLDPLDMTRKVKETSLDGRYRYVYANVSDLQWSFLAYDHATDSTTNFIKSDLDNLEKKQNVPVETASDDVVEKKGVALLLEFSLKSSQYATMVMRELFHQETSSSFQSQFSK